MLQMRSIAAGFAAALLLVPQALAATLLVPSQYPTIQSAVNAAVSGDEIVVAPGVYAAGFNYNGKRLTVRSSGGAASTIIDLTASGGTAVTAAQSEQPGTRFDGFTVRAATDSAIKVGSGASLDVVGCRIQDCATSRIGGGAAISVVGGDISAVQCEFRNLSVSVTNVDHAAIGGAVSLSSDASALFSLCTFENCSAASQDSRRAINTFYYPKASGGAIWGGSSTLLVERCTFTNCRVDARRLLGPNDDVNECWAGWGSAIGAGGAVGLEAGAFASIDTSSFGGDAGCRAEAQIERNWYGANTPSVAGYAATPRQVYAVGGAVSVREGARLESRNSTYLQCATSVKIGHPIGIFCGSGSTIYPPVSAFSEGGAIYAAAPPGASLLLSSTSDRFEGGQCLKLAELGAGSPCCDPCASNGCLTIAITWSIQGGAIMVRPALASTAIVGGDVRSVGVHSIEIEGGTGATVSNTSFSQVTGLVVDGNSALITGCRFANITGNPLQSISSGTGPTVASSYFCQNTPNTILGPWINGGGNEFAKACLTNDCNDNNIEDSFEIANGQVPDCNANGVPDSCDIASASSDDCDENEIPDDCQYRATLVTSPSLSPVQSGTTLTHSFQGLAFAGTDVVISVLANADLSSTTETIQVKSGATVLGTLFQTGGADCTPVTGELLVPRDTFNGLLTKGGTFSLQFVPSFAVTAGTCNPSSLVATVEYQPTVPGDCNGNALPDICDILAGTEADTNGDFIPDSCQDLPACPADLNLDGQVGAQDISLLLAVWGSANAAADINDDGTVNAQDLGLLLAAWGACP